jgi:tetratricopeptide (TPR) repeat protein
MRWLPLTSLLVALAIGCSGAADSRTDARRDAHAAFTAGAQALAAGQYEQALDELSAAVAAGGLNPDAFAAAELQLALALGGLGRYAEAYERLERLEAGAPNVDEVHAARSAVLAREGKAAEAQAELAQARQINRAVRTFSLAP